MSDYPSVAIRLSGKVGSIGDVVYVFERHGCPRRLAYEVAEQLRARGERITHVMTSVDLDLLKLELALVGITVEKL